MSNEVGCPEDNICFTEQQWNDFLVEYELDIVNEVNDSKDVICIDGKVNILVKDNVFGVLINI